MLKYTGEGDYSQINLRVFGDGYTKDVTIDLTKAPFNLTFKGFVPKNVGIVSSSGQIPTSVSLNGDTLIIIYDRAPEATDFPAQMVAPPEPRSVFSAYFVYGTGVTREVTQKNPSRSGQL